MKLRGAPHLCLPLSLIGRAGSLRADLPAGASRDFPPSSIPAPWRAESAGSMLKSPVLAEGTGSGTTLEGPREVFPLCLPRPVKEGTGQSEQGRRTLLPR